MIVRWEGRLCFGYVRAQREGPVIELRIADRLLATLTLDAAAGAVVIVVANGVERGELLDAGLRPDACGALVRVHRPVPALEIGFPMLRAAA